MVEERAQRRLATILAADVVGYSRLMEQDEAGTLAALKARRRDVLNPLVSKHQGRIFKTTGDGVLVEFGSAVNAVHCAVDLQQGMAAANVGQSEDLQIVLRIGVNLGDVMVEGGDLYGDGVNIAARLEALAEPGGILLSGTAYDQVKNKIKTALVDIGPQPLKNISEPVRAYRVTDTPTVAVAAPKIAASKPSIAVLPFTNMSGDPEQAYFSDGITEDIITDLSQVSALFVVARNTSFTFKGQAVEVIAAARKLNVGYVLEGSVRKARNRIRITVQLIDGATGGHLWAERYDRDFGDIFSLQDDISKNVVSALRVRLLPEELKTISARSTLNAEAYQCYLQGRSILQLTWSNKSELRSAREMFARAAKIDPGYARAYAGIADCDAFLWVNGDFDISYDQMLTNSSKALELAPNLAEAHASKALALYLTGHSDEANSEFEQAIELDAELFGAHFFYGFSCRDSGRLEKAVTLLERAAELSPTHPISLTILADLYKALDRPEQSELAARRTMARIDPILKQHPERADMMAAGAATLVYLGENVRAEEWAHRAITLEPENYAVRYNVACTFAVIGKSDAALECLEYIYSRKPRARHWLLGIMGHDTQLGSLRGRPDFQGLMKRLQDYAATHS